MTTPATVRVLAPSNATPPTVKLLAPTAPQIVKVQVPGVPGPRGFMGIGAFVWSAVGVLVPRPGTQRLYVDQASTLTGVRASVNVAPAGQSIIFTVLRNGVVMTTVEISDGENTVFTAMNIVLGAGDFFTVDITQVGTTRPGSDGTIQLRIA